ncbi:DEAD/DEAH box helicase [soil metagenome]
MTRGDVTRSVRLRPWQARALDQFVGSGVDFLAVATPGAGKTTFALAAALSDLASSPRRRVVVVAPTAHLKTQWAEAAARFDLHLDPAWSTSDGALPADMHGVVVTYQQVAMSAVALARLSTGAFAILDEIHHAGDERSWGDGLQVAFSQAGRRLALSGTPFRSDTNAIPFVHYDGDIAEPDFEYGYGEALADGKVVRPVFFPRTDGRMEWMGADGVAQSATFADRLDATGSSQRLRTALSLHGEWLPAVLDAAQDRLRKIRGGQQPDAGGLVIATDQEHARGIAALLRDRYGVDPVVATSEDADASARISRFATGTAPWLVAVRMVSEGVDIPRLRVGVYATTTTTELFFRQAVGRFVRWRTGLRRQQAYLFLPDDYRLRRWAVQIAEQRRHNLRRRDDDTDDEDLAPEPVAREPRDQLSLFAAISATPLGAPAESGPAFDDVAVEPDPGDDGTLPVALAPPPPLPGRTADEPITGPRTRHAQKRQLRDHNTAKVRTLARLTGLTHSKINLELNRRVGIRRIGEATVDQLERRVRSAGEWIRSL